MPPSSPPEADFNGRTSVHLHPQKGQTLTGDTGVELSLKQTQWLKTQTQWPKQLTSPSSSERLTLDQPKQLVLAIPKEDTTVMAMGISSI